MFSPMLAAVRSSRRSLLMAALLAATLLAAGGTPARAQYPLYYDDDFVELVSRNDQLEYVKQTDIFVPGEDYIVAYFDAGSQSGAPYYHIYLYLVDWTDGGLYLESAEVQDGITDREFAVGFDVIPGHEYSIVMYTENVQTSHWYFYTDWLEVIEY